MLNGAALSTFQLCRRLLISHLSIPQNEEAKQISHSWYGEAALEFWRKNIYICLLARLEEEGMLAQQKGVQTACKGSSKITTKCHYNLTNSAMMVSVWGNYVLPFSQV